jgi:tRNA uridine 5-carboxymethylaminomethyl modification enzyme
LVGDAQWAAFERKQDRMEQERARLQALWVKPPVLEAMPDPPLHLSRPARALELLARPEMNYAKLMCIPGVGPGVADPAVAEQLEIAAHYAGYIQRQEAEIARHRAQEETVIPADLDYARVRGLSHEVREKLARHRPATLGQAARISGVTPAAVSLLLIQLKRRAG